MAQAFCLLDEDGNLIGKTFLCKVVDEATGAVTWEKKVNLIGSADVEDYDPAVHGPESECAGNCEESQSGGITTW